MTITIIDISPGSTVVIKDGYLSDLTEYPFKRELPPNREPVLSEISIQDNESPPPLTEDQIEDLHRNYKLMPTL